MNSYARIILSILIISLFSIFFLKHFISRQYLSADKENICSYQISGKIHSPSKEPFIIKVFQGSNLLKTQKFIGKKYSFSFSSPSSNSHYLIVDQSSSEGVIEEKIYKLEGLICNQAIENFDLEIK